MEDKKLRILKIEEETWRHKSLTIWLTKGDQNRIFFHWFADQWRVGNAFSELSGIDGHIINGQNNLKAEADFFLRDLDNSSIVDEMKVIQCYPHFFYEEEGILTASQVSLKEVNYVLGVFSKDKSLGSDGWTIEFFLDFFDLMGYDILVVLEESRIKGQVFVSLNATFVSLIPKSDKPASLNDFKPISLCNSVYKIITKVISNRIKPMLSKLMTKKQFVFLDQRHILDAIGVAQRVSS